MGGDLRSIPFNLTNIYGVLQKFFKAVVCDGNDTAIQ
jgi:hypothetical protein